MEQDRSLVQGSQAVHRCLAILDLFSPHKPVWSFAEICTSTELAPSTAARLVRALEAHGLLMGAEADLKSYTLGIGVMRLANVILDGDAVAKLLRVSAPFLDEARSKTGETVGLHVRMGSKRVCVAEVESGHAIRMRTSVGGVQPLYAGAAGKVLLAWLADDALEDILPSQLDSLTDKTTRDVDTLLSTLHEVRNSGFAVSLGEVVQGAVGLAVPVLDGRNRIAASINVTGPQDRFGAVQAEGWAVALMEIAGTLSRSLGYSGSVPVRGELT